MYDGETKVVIDGRAERHPFSKVTISGDDAKLAIWQPDEEPKADEPPARPGRGVGRWAQVDRLTGADGGPQSDGSFRLTGTSEALVEAGVPPVNAVVVWEIKPRGCKSCR